MRALCWEGVNEVALKNVPEPRVLQDRDAIVKVTRSSLCGADLPLLAGYAPSMQRGDVMGREFMGEVVETGLDVRKIRPGQRVVAFPAIGCGRCEECGREEWSLCANSNANSELLEADFGHSAAGMFGSSHAFGGYAGGHAELVRVPYADFNCHPVPDEVSDEQAIFISDAAPSGFMSAELCAIEPGDTVAVWGCGAIGLMAIRSAYLLGAEQVVGIDRVEYRLSIARDNAKAVSINTTKEGAYERLLELTGGRGPDRCIDAGGGGADAEEGTIIGEAIRACRKGGTISIAGAYPNHSEHFPLAAFIHKRLAIRAGGPNGQRYAAKLFNYIIRSELDPSFLLTHPMRLEDGRRGYEIFRDRQEGCVRVVFSPQVH